MHAKEPPPDLIQSKNLPCSFTHWLLASCLITFVVSCVLVLEERNSYHMYRVRVQKLPLYVPVFRV